MPELLGAGLDEAIGAADGEGDDPTVDAGLGEDDGDAVGPMLEVGVGETVGAGLGVRLGDADGIGGGETSGDEVGASENPGDDPGDAEGAGVELEPDVSFPKPRPASVVQPANATAATAKATWLRLNYNSSIPGMTPA